MLRKAGILIVAGLLGAASAVGVAAIGLAGWALVTDAPPIREGQSLRLLFRSAHIYLLFASLLNVLLGTYAAPALTPRRRALQQGGSLLVALGPPLFLLAFFREPSLVGLVRPYARWGIYGALAGVLPHLVAGASTRGVPLALSDGSTCSPSRA